MSKIVKCLSQFKTQVKLNVLPLGVYDVLIGMDQLEKHKVVFKFFEKTFTCIDDKGETITVKGIPRKFMLDKFQLYK